MVVDLDVGRRQAVSAEPAFQQVEHLDERLGGGLFHVESDLLTVLFEIDVLDVDLGPNPLHHRYRSIDIDDAHPDAPRPPPLSTSALLPARGALRAAERLNCSRVVLAAGFGATGGAPKPCAH